MVFTKQKVVELWNHQFNSGFHPYTCENREDHPVLAGDKGVLVPTVRGWICPFCDYTQDWSH